MSDHLPPLTALRAFEAAARHMSFSKAADELHVTPAALSFQIKSLETHLGAAVFHRLNRAVELTEAGRALYPNIAEGFDALSRGWRAVRGRLDRNRLVVTAGPGFTAKWLAPRLFEFAQAHPEIELRFSASLRMMDFDRDDVDVAIRFGQSSAAEDENRGLFSRRIITEWAAPMVSPALADRLKKPADLLDLPLLHQDDTAFLRPPMSWEAYFTSLDLSPPGEPGTHFSQADHAIDAALSGAGAVLGRISMTERHLGEGRLVMPFAHALDLQAAYRFVCPKGSETRPQIARFLDWITDETAKITRWGDGVAWLAR